MYNKYFGLKEESPSIHNINMKKENKTVQLTFSSVINCALNIFYLKMINNKLSNKTM